MRIKKKFQGASTYRYKDNPNEKLFAEHWQKHNTQGRGPTSIEYALSEDNRGDPNPPITDRENMVAATVIQWLGSPVGADFLQGVLGDPRYRR